MGKLTLNNDGMEVVVYGVDITDILEQYTLDDILYSLEYSDIVDWVSAREKEKRDDE